MRHFFIFLVLILVIKGYSQTTGSNLDIVCNGFENASLTPIVTLNGYVQKQYIKKSDLLQYGLLISSGDATFKVIGFKALYNCHSGVAPAIDEKTYIGIRINGEDNFIKGINIGDHFLLDCINLEKDGKRYLITGVMFKIY